jgi:hypothetical protein
MEEWYKWPGLIDEPEMIQRIARRHAAENGATIHCAAPGNDRRRGGHHHRKERV